MKSLNRIVDAVYNKPWLITDTTLKSVHLQLENYLKGNIQLPAPVPQEAVEDASAMIVSPNIALITVDGIIGKHLSLLETQCGGCDLDSVCAALDEAAADPQISTIVIYFNSPGGQVVGTPEAAAKIAAISKIKPTIGYCDVMACSAAYWLASQCNYFYCAPSSLVGSINTYSLYLDETVSMAQEGLKINYFTGKNGTLKLLGASFKEMTAEDKAIVQEGMNKIEAEFFASVNANRSIALEDMRGQVFTGLEAVSKNLADGNADSLDELITFLGNQPTN